MFKTILAIVFITISVLSFGQSTTSKNEINIESDSISLKFRINCFNKHRIVQFKTMKSKKNTPSNLYTQLDSLKTFEDQVIIEFNLDTLCKIKSIRIQKRAVSQALNIYAQEVCDELFKFIISKNKQEIFSCTNKNCKNIKVTFPIKVAYD